MNNCWNNKIFNVTSCMHNNCWSNSNEMCNISVSVEHREWGQKTTRAWLLGSFLGWVDRSLVLRRRLGQPLVLFGVHV